jgi:hypothetical protein
LTLILLIIAAKSIPKFIIANRASPTKPKQTQRHSTEHLI